MNVCAAQAGPSWNTHPEDYQVKQAMITERVKEEVELESDRLAGKLKRIDYCGA